jgi:hypothetical protein
VYAVTDDRTTQLRDHRARQQHPGAKRRRYLPSEQVVRELVSQVPDWSGLAEELRDCLSDEPAESGPVDPSGTP